MSSRSSTRSSFGSSVGSVGRGVVGGTQNSCKHCQNLGVDSNHALRDRSGKLSCPILLNNVCRRCGKKGHTVSRCVATIESFERSATAYAKAKAAAIKAEANKAFIQPKNVFASLMDDDDEAAVLPPVLRVGNCGNTKVLTPLMPLINRVPTYADILANRNQIRSPTTTPPRIRGINWASDDSDDEQ